MLDLLKEGYQEMVDESSHIMRDFEFVDCESLKHADRKII